MTRVSVIIPTWNRVEETGRAVQSVLNQTFQDFEIIIADDGSTDSTPAKFAHHPDPRVHYLQLEHSGLPAVARNAALHQAQGELAAFLDSDDEWMPEKLERQLTFMTQNPEFGTVCANAWVRRENSTQQVALYHTEPIESQAWPLADLVKTNIIITSSLLANRQAILAVGGFPEDSVFRAIEDYGLWLRLTVKSQLFYLAEPLLFYADVGNSIRSQQRIEEYTAGLKRLFDELAIYTRSETSAVKKNIAVRQAGCLKDLLRIASAKRKINEVKIISMQILALEPGNIRNYKLILKSIFQSLQRAH